MMMPDFSIRSVLPEKMDQEGVPANEINQALNELETVNRLLGGFNVTLSALSKIKFDKQPVKIMDIGCGGGDMLRKVADWFAKKNLKVKLTGVDRNPLMGEFARIHSTNYSNIEFKTLDVFDKKFLEERTDVCMNTLFCHHFDKDELVNLVRRMLLISDKAVVINDLHRHWFAYYSIKFITSIFSKTYLVRYDAPLSVARSLTRNEWKEVLNEAGVKHYSIKWMWAWRWQIVIQN